MGNSKGTILARLISLIRSREFIVLTLVGNSLILISSVIIYLIEKDINPLMKSFIDSVWWAFATVTTVGYGDVVPVSTTGKIFGVFLMLLGTGLFATFTALFANAILGRQVSRLKGEVRHIRSGMRDMHDEFFHEEEHFASTIDEIRSSLERLESKLVNKNSKKER